jgi:predicted nucleic acid-binding protein
LTLYLDSSALLKRYVDEPDSERFRAILGSDDRQLTCRLTWVEIWRNLGLRLVGDALRLGRVAFRTDWRRMDVVEIDAGVAEEAGRLADLTGCRSLDALHLAAMGRAGPNGIDLVTADLRQAQAARTLGWSVLGA